MYSVYKIDKDTFEVEIIDIANSLIECRKKFKRYIITELKDHIDDPNDIGESYEPFLIDSIDSVKKDGKFIVKSDDWSYDVITRKTLTNNWIVPNTIEQKVHRICIAKTKDAPVNVPQDNIEFTEELKRCIDDVNKRKNKITMYIDPPTTTKPVDNRDFPWSRSTKIKIDMVRKRVLLNSDDESDDYDCWS